MKKFAAVFAVFILSFLVLFANSVFAGPEYQDYYAYLGTDTERQCIADHISTVNLNLTSPSHGTNVRPGDQVTIGGSFTFRHPADLFDLCGGANGDYSFRFYADYMMFDANEQNGQILATDWLTPNNVVTSGGSYNHSASVSKTVAIPGNWPVSNDQKIGIVARQYVSVRNSPFVQVRAAKLLEHINVVGIQPSPTPTPTPTPVGGVGGGDINTNTNTNTNTNNNNVNVNVNNSQSQTVNVSGGVTTAAAVSPAGQVKGQAITTKGGVTTQPETGVSVLGMATMAGLGPLGFMLSRYGRSRVVTRREEDLNEVAGKAFFERQRKRMGA